MQVEIFIENGVKYRRVIFESGAEAVELIGDESLPDDYEPPAPAVGPSPEQLKIAQLESELADYRGRTEDLELMMADIIFGGG